MRDESIDHWASHDADSDPIGSSGTGRAQPHRPDAALAATVSAPGGGFSGQKRHPGIFAIVIGIHVLFGMGLMTLNYAAGPKKIPEALTMLRVDQEPEPLPPEPPPPSPPQLVEPIVQPVVVAPDPIIRTATPPPVIRTTPKPPPVKIALVATSDPGPPAPPAPVTPPDFKAAQLGNPAPSYPYLSRKAREEGVVMLRVMVTPEGRAGEVRLERSCGHNRLDDAAMATVKKWRFMPARRAGEAVAAWVLVPITFALG